MSAERLNVRDMTVMAVFAAALAVMSQISIPMPSGVPITLQTFALALIGYSLGAKRGAMAVLVYLLLGAVGVPVFANFHGGAAVFFRRHRRLFMDLLGHRLILRLKAGRRPWTGHSQRTDRYDIDIRRWLGTIYGLDRDRL